MMGALRCFLGFRTEQSVNLSVGEGDVEWTSKVRHAYRVHCTRCPTTRTYSYVFPWWTPVPGRWETSA